jgi:hypothetical protein
MSERANLTAAPAIAEIDGVEYRMSPLRDIDLGELDRWVQRKILQTAELSSDELTRKAAVELAAVATWSGKYGHLLSMTKEGIARYMLVGLRVNHPELTLNTLIAWVSDDKKRSELHRAFDIANDVSATVARMQAKGDAPSDPTAKTA